MNGSIVGNAAILGNLIPDKPTDDNWRHDKSFLSFLGILAPAASVSPIGLRTIMAKLVRPIRTACSRADGVSRDTARKGEAAHQMSLLSEIQFPTIATNDN
jgi:hypothetical protein